MTDQFDRTALRAEREGYRVHRDYASHFFRWSWAVSRSSSIGAADKTVLDFGCGRELPLLNVATHRSQLPRFYVGVDLNPLRELTASESKRAAVYGRTDVTDAATWQLLRNHHGQFDLITCFEVIEHMPVEDGWKLLWGANLLLKPGGEFLLSTPVFNGKAASNHVHEYTVDELNWYVTAAGFEVVARYGTFANVRDVKPAMRKWYDERNMLNCYDSFEKLWDELAKFHSSDVLATFVAPVIPDAARNNVWRLRR